MNIKLEELSFRDSRKLLTKFQQLEKSYGADWYDTEEEGADYIWLIKNLDDPLGFLSYKLLRLSNQMGFVYIVKIYVLKAYRGRNPILIDEERVSEVLLRTMESKGFNILTLESACDKLDRRYKELGFEYIEDLSREFGSVLDTSEKIFYKRINIEDEMIDRIINGSLL